MIIIKINKKIHNLKLFYFASLLCTFIMIFCKIIGLFKFYIKLKILYLNLKIINNKSFSLWQILNIVLRFDVVTIKTQWDRQV